MVLVRRVCLPLTSLYLRMRMMMSSTKTAKMLPTSRISIAWMLRLRLAIRAARVLRVMVDLVGSVVRVVVVVVADVVRVPVRLRVAAIASPTVINRKAALRRGLF